MDGERAPPAGWTEITCHLIFDVKMTLCRKACYVDIFKYLDIHKDNELAFDPTYLGISNPFDNTKESKISRMKKYYPDAEEALPSNAPEPRDLSVQINCFVDADHEGDRITR